MARTGLWVCEHCDHDLGDMTLVQGHDTPYGHGQQFYEILSRSNLAMRSYSPDTSFGYVCTVALTSEIWPWVKVMTHPSVIGNKFVKYYPDHTWQWGVMARIRISSICALWPWPWRYDLGSRSWHTLGSWTTSMKCYPDQTREYEVIARTPFEQTDRLTDVRTDGQTDRVIPIYPLPPPQKKKLCLRGYNKLWCRQYRQ